MTCESCGDPIPDAQRRTRRFCASCGRKRGDSARKRAPSYDPEARRDRTLVRRYGITVEEYDALFDAQQGKCALCGGDSNGRGRLAVDHDHATGRVRGLLCFTCNTALGRLERVGLDRVREYAD